MAHTLYTLPKKAVKNIKSVPRSPDSFSPSGESVSIARKANGTRGDVCSPCRVFSCWTSSYVGNFVATSYGGGAEISAFGGGISSPPFCFRI